MVLNSLRFFIRSKNNNTNIVRVELNCTMVYHCIIFDIGKLVSNWIKNTVNQNSDEVHCTFACKKKKIAWLWPLNQDIR